VNARKSFFGKPELEYLGYWITRHSIQPKAKKVEAIMKIATPKNKRELRHFIGMVNFYRDMWIRRSEILAPLSALTGKDSKWTWTEKQQHAFDTMKRIVSKETLLAYPDFSQPFDIHTDASHTQLGAVISQNNKPIAFYSRKLNPAQTRYTTTERELLAIVETLKEFKNILLGQNIRVYTDHKNLMFKNFNTERVMRWRLVLEEFGPDLNYVKGERNKVADALSRLNIDNSVELPTPNDLEAMADCFATKADDVDPLSYPLQHKAIMQAQKADKYLKKDFQRHPNKYQLQPFRGGDRSVELLTETATNKIVVPLSLQT
jgi:hypothetical protein